MRIALALALSASMMSGVQAPALEPVAELRPKHGPAVLIRPRFT